MQEFRVSWASPGKRTDPRLRLLLWEGAWIVVGGAVIVYSVSVGLRALCLLGMGIVVLSLCIFNTLGSRAAVHKVKGELTFYLTNNELIGNRTGGREVRISFSEIVSLRERFGWLTVLAANPARKVAIPKDVDGYDSLKSVLSKYAPVNTAGPLFHDAAVPSLVLLSIMAWFLLLGSANLRIKQIAAVAALLLLLLSSFRILRITKESAKVPSLVLIATAWIAALVLIYVRIFVA